MSQRGSCSAACGCPAKIGTICAICVAIRKPLTPLSSIGSFARQPVNKLRAKPVLALLLMCASACNTQATDERTLPPAPPADIVSQIAEQTSRKLGSSFQPIFICGESRGKSFQPARSANRWIADVGPDAVIVAIDTEGAMEVLKQVNHRLIAASEDGGMIIPVRFDPSIGDIALAVAYPKAGVTESYTFSTFTPTLSFLSWTVNLPQSGATGGGRGVQALLAQCVEMPLGGPA